MAFNLSATASATSWSNLPEDVLEHVAVRLRTDKDRDSLRALRCVNKHWSRSLASVTTCLHPKDLEKDEFPVFLQKVKTIFGNVQRLELPVVWFDDECCHQLASQVPNLKSLEIFWGDNISDEGLKELASMSLKSLKVYHSCLLTDDGIAALSKTSLEELWLYGANQVTDNGFHHLRSLESLKALRLMYCNGVSRHGLEPLVKREGLQISARFCRRISSEIKIT